MKANTKSVPVPVKLTRTLTALDREDLIIMTSN